MKKTKGFAPSCRYKYDSLLNAKEGWAQVDTGSDASYFGTWTSPSKKMIFNYCEGDTCLTECERLEEYQKEIDTLCNWHLENDGFFGIDHMCNEKLKKDLEDIGLEKYFKHQRRKA